MFRRFSNLIEACETARAEARGSLRITNPDPIWLVSSTDDPRRTDAPATTMQVGWPQSRPTCITLFYVRAKCVVLCYLRFRRPCGAETGGTPRPGVSLRSTPGYIPSPRWGENRLRHIRNPLTLPSPLDGGEGF